MRYHLICAMGLLISGAVLPSLADTFPAFLHIKDLRVLIVVYRGDTNDTHYMDDHEYQTIVNAIECGRLFYFRNTRGALNLTLTFLPINTMAPDNHGPTYEHIEADLRRRGYVDNQFDGVFTTGRGLFGNWGGFRIFDRTGAAFGIPGMGGQMRQFPSADTNTGFNTAWVFVHEFQHALDLAIAGSAGFDEFLHGHPYTDAEQHPGRVVKNPGAQHWDWEACTLRNFPFYQQLPGATSSEIFALDSDGDGLADYHPALPMDETRFGTDPHNPDTDGDGLSDLEEFTADIYLGADPRNPDTDDDGLPDAADPWPTVAISAHLPYAHPAPLLDGVKDTVYQPLIIRWYAASDTHLWRDAVQTYACWDEDTLYLYARAPQPFTLEMQTDSSPENGFWIGGDTYCWSVRHGQQPVLDAPHMPWWPGSTAVWSRADNGDTECELMLPAQIGRRGVTSGMEFPEDIAEGLRLLGGRDVSFNIAFDFPAARERVLLTPPWSMVSTRLRKTPADPDRPLLRYTPPAQATNAPCVRIDGVAAAHTVAVINARGELLGTRTGSGWLTLHNVITGHDRASGLTVLRARTSSGAESAPFELVADIAAQPPVITTGAPAGSLVPLRLAGEPAATIIVELKEAGRWMPLISAMLGSSGATNLLFDTALHGFRAEYFASDVFTNPALWRIDSAIAFDYEDQSPARGVLKPERFSVRWTGWLSVPAATTATWFLTTDDGSRLYIDEQLVLDHWGTHGKEEKQVITPLAAGEHALRVDYYENLGWAAAHLEWQPQGGARTNAIPVRAVPAAQTAITIRARQIDALGNVSAPSEPLVLAP